MHCASFSQKNTVTVVSVSERVGKWAEQCASNDFDSSQSLGPGRRVHFFESVGVLSEDGVLSMSMLDEGNTRKNARRMCVKNEFSASKNDRMYRRAAEEHADLKGVFDMVDDYTTV